jgi:ethanolamine transporter EutH
MVSMLITFVTVTPVLATLKHQEETDITVNAAFAVCGASCLAAHLGFVLAVDRGMTGAMVISKLAGGVCAAAVAMLLAAKHRAVSEK